MNHSSFSNIRAYYQVPNKKNKFPILQGIIGGTNIDIGLKLNKENKIEINPLRQKRLAEFNSEYSKFLNGEEFNPFIFKVDIEPPQKIMSRFLAKMGLEMFAYRFLESGSSPESIVDEKFFDPIRNYVRYGRNPETWVYKSRRIFPMDTLMKDKTEKYVQVGYGCDLFHTKRRETYFFFLFYGVEFIINIGGNSIRGYEEWLNENNHISPILERTGSKVISRKEGKEIRYYIEGELSSKEGILFDLKQMNK